MLKFEYLLLRQMLRVGAVLDVSLMARLVYAWLGTEGCTGLIVGSVTQRAMRWLAWLARPVG